MLYELVTGRVPFEAETPLAVLLKHINDPLPLPRQIKPDLPEQVERVILKAMAKAPDDRYQSAQGMVDALAEAVAATPTEIVSPPLPSGAADATTCRASARRHAADTPPAGRGRGAAQTGGIGSSSQAEILAVPCRRCGVAGSVADCRLVCCVEPDRRRIDA